MADHAHTLTPGFDASLVAEALDAALSIRKSTPVFGIVGLQGSGKSTLAAQVASLATDKGLEVAVVSLDDFYMRRQERLQLSSEVHPLLATRGPPGTHDMTLALETMTALRQGVRTALPRFDKLADDRAPMPDWPIARSRCDLVILEGWFLKTPPQDEAELSEPVNALERDEDAQGIWRHYCNTALATRYPSLWDTVDTTWFLQGPGFEVVPEWRWQQEQSLQSAQAGRTAMSRAQVERFVQFFERVSRQALKTLPAIAERTVHLDSQRRSANLGVTPPRR
jgi:D-glycerate 3-kinase